LSESQNNSPHGEQVTQQALASGGWTSFLGFFVTNKLVVLVVLGVLLLAGLSSSPVDLTDGAVPRDPVPVDAIPDIGENQQIVFTRWPGRSPRDVEDQISYPLTSALLGIPGVRSVRSSSMLGFSTIYLIFEDDIEFYWSRARTLEKLSSLPKGALPNGVSPSLGPDATALGQVFWYTLEGRDPNGNIVGGWDLHELRSIQDFNVRFALQAVPGVSEVASVGGHIREYQVDVDREAMLAFGVSLQQVAKAVRHSNRDVGARTLEINRAEYLVRGIGFVKTVADLEGAVIASRDHTPIRISDIAHVSIGPAQRRGALDDGGAETVGGVVVARYGENPLQVIERVKQKLQNIGDGLPSRTLEDGTISKVTVVPFYDRAELIDETLETLWIALRQEILVTIIVILLMLRDIRSSLLVASVLPLGVLAAFVAMRHFGVDANIMALSGIAIAIGTMVDISIVFTENIVNHLGHTDRKSPEPGDRPLDRGRVVAAAAAEVAPAVLTSVLTTVLSFLPVFALTASEGKLFTPLAWTKTFAMLAALAIAMIVVPAFAHVLIAPPIKDLPGAPKRTFAGLRKLLHRHALSNWTLVLGGGLLLPTHLPAGAILLTAGILRLLTPLLPSRFGSPMRWLETAVAVVVVSRLLSDDWTPLGPNAGVVSNWGFVSLLIAILMAVLLVFGGAYQPLLRAALRNKTLTLSIPAAVLVFGLCAWLGFARVFSWAPPSITESATYSRISAAMPGFGREFMPPFDEGSFLYMPTTMAHASIGQALEMLSEMDAAIAAIPEVERAVGKLGRVDSALDPAPVSMFETVVTYIPEYRFTEGGERIRQWRDSIRNTGDIWDEIVRLAKAPGLTSAPLLMPINTRIVMLQSGMRAPMGIKVFGSDLRTIEEFGLRLEEELRAVPSVRPETVFADRVVGKPYVEIDIDREAISRYGLSIFDVQDVIEVALGGKILTTTVEGRERYPVRVRYMREDRDNIDALQRVLVPSKTGAQIPLGQLASISYLRGPQVIKSEDTMLVSFVLFDRDQEVSEVDVVEAAKDHLRTQIDAGSLKVPPGVSYRFSGSYENQVRSEKRLRVLVPLALVAIFLLLYLQFRRVSTTLVIFSGALVALAGGFVLLWLYGLPGFLDFHFADVSLRRLFQVETLNMSVAVWIGFIALLGIATDSGVVMATYLQQLFKARPPKDVADIHELAVAAGSRRVTPCLMTTATTALALLPVVGASGRGADVMMTMALPSLGGMATILLTLFVVPVLYSWVEERRLDNSSARD